MLDRRLNTQRMSPDALGLQLINLNSAEARIDKFGFAVFAKHLKRIKK